MPKVSFVVTCKGRLEHLQATIESALRHCDEYVLVDYTCPENSGRWVSDRFPKVFVVDVPKQEIYHRAHARNLGAAVASGDILCFLDCDIILAESFIETINDLLPGQFLAVDHADEGLTGLIACWKEDFVKLGGYDEAYVGYGCEDIDLQIGLEFVLGRSRHLIPRKQVRHLNHSDDLRTRFHEEKDIWKDNDRNRMIMRTKFRNILHDPEIDNVSSAINAKFGLDVSGATVWIPGNITRSTRNMLRRKVNNHIDIILESRPTSADLTDRFLRYSMFCKVFAACEDIVPSGFGVLQKHWDYIGRVIPIARNTIEVAQILLDNALKPDLIFLHYPSDLERLVLELEGCFRLFPNTPIYGDGWSIGDRKISRIVAECARRHQLAYSVDADWLWELRQKIA